MKYHLLIKKNIDDLLKKLPDDVVMYQLKKIIIFTVWIIEELGYCLLIYFRKIK